MDYLLPPLFTIPTEISWDGGERWEEEMPLPPSHPSSQAALGKLRLPSPILDPDSD